VETCGTKEEQPVRAMSSLRRSDLFVEKKEPFPHRVDYALVRKRNVHDTEGRDGGV
jgi:hypothetical protein